MHLHFAIVAFLCVAAGTNCVAQVRVTSADGLLLNWNFDQGQRGTVKDLSGNDLDGNVSAAWVESPCGRAVMMDGTSKGMVSVQVPEAKRFGKKSWTFMAMFKPHQFSIDDQQNQRRIFAFGQYPAAYLVIDISGGGRLMCHFCYRDAAGKIVSAGGSSSLALAENVWAHVALVCDRDNHEIEMYVNGYSSGTSGNADRF